MSTKSVSTKLKNKLAMFVAKKAQAAKLETEMKELKTEIDAELDLIAKANGFTNGKLGLPGVAMVSVALNPPKLVWSTGESLTPVEREGLALLLPERYIKQDVRIADVFKAAERGHDRVASILADKAIKAVQDSRYDIKAA